MYKVTGSNIFGQWFSDECIISGFCDILTEHKTINLCRAKLLFISWSYNIFQIDNELYISGSYNGKEKQLSKIKLPEECDITELIVCGNDNNLLLVGKNTNNLWVMNLEKVNEFKKVNFSVETPLGNVTKRLRRNNEIVQVVMMNDSCMYLTSSGMVYRGLLPSYLDTSHCIGEVCDIQCGYEHFLLLTNAGRVYTWGNGRRLQLGHGDVNNLDSPTEIEALAGIKVIKIRAGGWHSLALSEYGDLYSWGWNDTGQLGTKETDTTKDNQSYSIPTLVDLFDENGQVDQNIKDIACGSRHSAVLLEDNSVWTTGYNKYGQLGFSPEEHPSKSCFMKSFQCSNDVELMCGPWSSVIRADIFC